MPPNHTEVTLYRCMASITLLDQSAGYSMHKKLPSFMLDGNLLGIVNADHAKKIAAEIVNPLDDDRLTVSVSVVPIPAELWVERIVRKNGGKGTAGSKPHKYGDDHLLE